MILIATGSEVALALAAHEELSAEGIRSRVVSLPCWELFDRQDEAYRDEVLPPAVTARVSVEEASTLGWDRYVGSDGATIGMHTFGTLGAAEGRADQVRLHPRQGGRGGAREAARHERPTAASCTTWARASGSTTSPARCSATAPSRATSTSSRSPA